MHQTRIKICGVTRPEDAAAAARAGADFVGIVLHAESPRAVALLRASEIISALPAGFPAVELFVDAPPDRIKEAANELGIATVQLHGLELPPLLRELPALRVWKAVRSPADAIAWRDAGIEAILLETDTPAGAGGTGQENDWRALQKRKLAGEFVQFKRVIVAGGLTPQNVGDVVRMLRPWAVDVSSGVEAGVKGIKSTEKIAALVRAVQEADASLTSA